MNNKLLLTGATILGSVAVGGLTIRAIKKRKKAVDYKVEEYIIGDLGDAEETMASLNETVERYGCVTIADYYDIIGVASHFQDSLYGWNQKSISKARIVQNKRGGYTIRFPQLEEM